MWSALHWRWRWCPPRRLWKRPAMICVAGSVLAALVFLAANPWSLDVAMARPDVPSEDTDPDLAWLWRKPVRLFEYGLPGNFSCDTGPPSRREGCRIDLYGAEIQFRDAVFAEPRAYATPADIQIVQDPRQADFFFLPACAVCMSIQEGRWDRHVGEQRALQVVEWARRSWPYWNRSQGVDHWMVLNHDLGRAYLTTDWARHLIVMTHASDVVDNEWLRDRMAEDDLLADQVVIGDPYVPQPKQCSLKRHPQHCHPQSITPTYDVWRDIAIPTVTFSDRIRELHLSGVWRKRDRHGTLAYFRGTLFLDYQYYSWGIRQRLYHQYRDDDLIRIREGSSPDYHDEIMNSTFCLSLPGNAMWSPRLVDGILLGCIPVIVTDRTVLPFDPLLNWRLFSVRILASEVMKLKDILLSIPAHRIRSMQRQMERVQRHFIYNYPMQAGDASHTALQMLKLRGLNLGQSTRNLQAAWGY